jgi:hypothetical protein
LSSWRDLFGYGTINSKLDDIIRRLKLMAADQAALDQAVADLVTHTDAIDAAVQALIDKINSTPGTPDFSAEIASLTAATGNLQTATDAATTALNPTP